MFFKKIIFCFASVLFMTPTAFANMENLDDLVSTAPKAIELLGNIKDQTVTVYTSAEYAIYSTSSLNETLTNVLCHFHLENDVSHCRLLPIDSFVPDNFALVLTLEPDKINEMLNLLDFSPSISSDPVWPWVFGAIVSYYLAKKMINYWVYKSFKSKPHSHEQFFIEGDQLRNKIDNNHKSIIKRLTFFNALREIQNQTKVSKVSDSILSDYLTSKVFTLTQDLVEDLKHENCTGCGGAGHTHHLPNFSQRSSVLQLGHNRDAIRSSFELPYQLRTENLQGELPVSKQISAGLIVRSAKAFILDLNKELVSPIASITKAALKTVSKKHNLNQLNVYGQTSFRVLLGESNYTAAISIALSLVTIKIVGESIESVFVGPYHVFCQLSDAAVVATGLGLFSAYHCLRQPIRKRNLKLLTDSNFWSILFKKIKNPLKIDQSGDGDSNEKAKLLLLAEVQNIKSEIKNLIWQLRLDGKLNPSQSNQLAIKLGSISKDLEDLLFDIELDRSLSATDLSTYLNMILPITDKFKSLAQETIQISLSHQTEGQLDKSNACLMYLSFN